MRFWSSIKNQSWFPYTVAICVGILFYMLLNNLAIIGGILSWIWVMVKPLLYALILAYLMDPIARFYEKKVLGKLKRRQIARQTAVVLSIVTVVIVIGLLSWGIFPTLIKSMTNMFQTFNSAIRELDSNAGQLSSILPLGLANKFKDVSISSTILSEASKMVTSNLDGIADTSATIGNGFANFIIAFVLAVYYMMDKDRLKNMARRFFVMILKEQKFATFQEFYHQADKILLKYISGNLLEATIVGAANAVFMLIARMPYVLLISIVVGVTNLAPTFGPIVGALVGAVLLVLVNPWYALAFLIFTAVIQTLDGYVIKPKLFGESLGVSPLLILIMIIMGGRIFGVIGIVLAIPVAAIAQYIADSLWTRHKNKTKSDESQKY